MLEINFMSMHALARGQLCMHPCMHADMNTISIRSSLICTQTLALIVLRRTIITALICMSSCMQPTTTGSTPSTAQSQGVARVDLREVAQRNNMKRPGVLQSDVDGEATAWANHQFDFRPSSQPPPPSERVVTKVHGHYQVNVAECAKLGMHARWLEVLSRGVDIMLDRVPVYDVRRDNYSSVHLNLQEANSMIAKQQKLGVLESVDHCPRVLQPLGMIEKKLEPGQEGPAAFRMITDAKVSGLNDCIRDCPFPLPSIRDAVRSGKMGWWAAKYDLKDGFYHIPVHPRFVDLLGIQLPASNQFARYRFLCFGLKCAPFFFQGTMCELRQCLLAQGILSDCAVLVYIDDWLLLAPTREGLLRNMQQFEQTMQRLGFHLHPTKRAGPVQAIEYIGFILDLLAGQLSLTVERCDRIRARIQELLAHHERSQRWLVSDVDSLTGKLSHAAYVVLGGRVALAPIYAARAACAARWKNPAASPPQGASFTPCVHCVESLRWWYRALLVVAPVSRKLFVYEDGSMDLWGPEMFPLASPTMTIPRPLSFGGILVVTSDASSTGGAFFVGTPFDSADRVAPYAFLWSPTQSCATSNFRECKTIDISQHWLGQRLRNKFILHFTDNTASVSVTSTWTSPSVSLASIGSSMRTRLTGLAAQAAAVHVPGVQNSLADAPSRAGEALYESMMVSLALIQLVESRFIPHRVVQVLGAHGPAGFPTASGDTLTASSARTGSPPGLCLWVPPPHQRESALKRALQSCTQLALTGSTIVMLLPHFDVAVHRWARYFDQAETVRLAWHSSLPPRIAMYSREVTYQQHGWISPPLVIPRMAVGTWHVWVALPNALAVPPQCGRAATRYDPSSDRGGSWHCVSNIEGIRMPAYMHEGSSMHACMHGSFVFGDIASYLLIHYGQARVLTCSVYSYN
jgi:hypothetical protein